MKKNALPKPTPSDNAVPDTEFPVRILKSATCPTLSGRSTLTYEIGSTPDSVGVIRLKSNTGGGIFNLDWIELAVIRSLLDAHPEDKQVTSYLLFPLFRGKSANSPAFLFSVLIAEGLVKLTSEEPRLYHKGAIEAFFSRVVALREEEGNADAASETPAIQQKRTGRKKLSEKRV